MDKLLAEKVGGIALILVGSYLILNKLGLLCSGYGIILVGLFLIALGLIKFNVHTTIKKMMKKEPK